MGPVVLGGWVNDRPDNRGFTFAIVASLVFHGVLIVAWQGMHKPVERPNIAPGPIVARLAAPPKPAVVAEPAPQVSEPPKPRVEEPPPSPSPTVPKPVVKPAPIAKPAPVPAKSAPVPAAPPKSAAEPAPTAPASPAAAPTPATRPDAQPAAPVVPATPAPSDEADAGTLRAYRLAIITAARRYKVYPRVAMDNNWEGKAEVRMVIGANGMIASMTIKTSTGHEILDKAAIGMITKAKPLTPIPAALRGKEFTVDVPVIFSLKDDAPGS